MLLCNLRFNRLLLYITTDGMVPFLLIFGSMFVSVICRTKCRSRSWCRNECPKWCFPCTCNVCTVLTLLRLLRLIRCNSRVFTMDHISVLHPIRIRGHSISNLLIWTRKIKMFPDILSFQVTTNDTGGT